MSNGKMPFRERFARFMMGRNGPDGLYNFLTVVALILIVVNMFLHSYASYIMSAVILAIIVYSIYRVFSRDLYRRRRENDFYLRKKKALFAFFRLQRDKWRDRKTHVYRRCPNCKNVLRLPRRKGDHNVCCPCCSHRFNVNIR